MSFSIFWLRRDLRLNDNAALYHALKSGLPVLPIFIFDTNILDKLDDRADARVTFLHDTVSALKTELEQMGSTLLVFYGNPTAIWAKITEGGIFSSEPSALSHQLPRLEKVFANHDSEPYALERDAAIQQILAAQNIDFQTFKDHVVFEKNEVVKDDGLPYTVFTPYSRKWRAKLSSQMSSYNGTEISFFLKPYPTENYAQNFIKTADLPPLSNLSVGVTQSHTDTSMLSLESMNFTRSNLSIPPKTVARGIIRQYDQTRNFPALPNSTSRLGIHFRFGTISIREKALAAASLNETYLNELIWRDFYAQILHHFPHIGAGKAFRSEYDRIRWVNDEAQFEQWCAGKTGYPMVDAGMRELNATGYMHNRVRMIVSSFLTKHLLIDWRWGEAYFAKKLLDFDLASNNGGWQWAAGSGTDAAPYFRIFNPESQREKFDKEFKYIRQWIPEFDTPQYPKPIVDHKSARERCLAVYAEALKK
jgi:deoxyribodipyrimidine photo-lyase